MSENIAEKNSRIKVLMVEDTMDHAHLMEIMLKKYDPRIDVIIAKSGVECLRILQEETIHLIILDYELPMMSGLEVLESIQRRKLDIPVIIVTGKGDETIAVQAMKKGVYDYLVKDKGYMYVLPRVVVQTLEKHELEKKLFESERKYQILFNSISDFISVQDIDFNITLANEVAAQMSNSTIQNLIGKKCYEQYFNSPIPCENCPVLKTFQTNQPDYLEKNHNKDVYNIRSHPIIGLNGKLNHVIEIGQVVTDQKRLEKQIIQSEKLATIGLLSSGIAHEIRNPLNIIETARYFIADTYAEKTPGLQNKLEIIRKNVTRASTIINNLLEFSRPSDKEKEPIDIMLLLEKTLSLFGKELMSQNIILKKSQVQSPSVFFNLDSLKQVLLNLIINAIQAMPHGGELKISAKLIDENSVDVLIEDTGCGISEKDIPFIFSPFFTTKEVGEGTGLGLYICQSIMEREGGKINVESQEGVGSTFTINLPIFKQ